jgi:acetylornithine deacetylase/succinyl-diaminopimelate desuccinylase-like protein
MWKNHRELIDAEYAINEGGGAPVETGGKLFYTCQAGEKGSTRLKMTAIGTPGHASVPLADTAMKHLGEALERLHAWQSPTVLTGPSRAMLQTLGDALGGETATVVAKILQTESAPWEWFTGLPLGESDMRELYAATRNTAVPTMIHGGVRINVIPSEVVVDIDGRILPGQDPEAFRQAVQDVVGSKVRIDLVSPDYGVASDPDSPFFEAIRETMQQLQPGSVLMPYMLTGGTDAALLPQIRTYGFFPMLPGERLEIYGPLVHGHNERIHVDDLAFGTRFIHDLVLRFCAVA